MMTTKTARGGSGSRAALRKRVPHDDEDAGAEATFGRTSFEGKQYLVAVRGSSWRRAGKNLYNQDRYERFGWRLGHTQEEAHVARPAQWNDR